MKEDMEEYFNKKFKVNKHVSRELEMEIIDRCIQLLREGVFNWRQKVTQEFAISYSYIRKLGDEIFSTYNELFHEDDSIYKERIKNKLEEFMMSLENQGDFEAATKMLDRIIKLKNLQTEIIELNVKGFKVKYGDEIDEVNTDLDI